MELYGSLRTTTAGISASLGMVEVDPQLTATDALVAGVRDGSALVGEMPPQPPTLRAKAGRALVSIVRRAVFWLSDQIRTFQVAVAASQEEHARLLRAQAAEILRLRQTVDALEARLVKREEMQAEADRILHQTRMQLALLERSLTTPSLELPHAGAEASGDAGSTRPAGDAVSLTDLIYVAFENLFRGDRGDIKQRFEVYIPRLKDARLGHSEMAVLDLGCGRGEWLELLRDEGLTGSGVDMNLVMIAECQSLGLSVTAGNAIQYLRSLPPASIGVVTGFHIVEHLPLDDLLALLDETNRVLRPGGMAIFETPNPSNLQVSTENFYLDPTHRNPLPKALLKFLVESRGLCDIEVLPLHPYPASHRLEDDGRAATRLLNELLFSEQDYAVIGRKA